MAKKSKSKKSQENQKSDGRKSRLPIPITIAIITTAGAIIVAIINTSLPKIIIKETPTNTASISCFYSNEKTDTEAIQWLIEQEANAVIRKDIYIIKGIFSEKAIIRDAAVQGGTQKKWNNPIDRYQTLFKDHDYLEAQNNNIKAEGPISDNFAIYISGSYGTYIFNGQTIPYVNPDNGNRWTIEKINGCWRITMLEFNLH